MLTSLSILQSPFKISILIVATLLSTITWYYKKTNQSSYLSGGGRKQ